MAKFSWALFALFCLGPPFYWGTLHNGVTVPLLWAAVMAVVIGLRRWRHFDRNAAILLVLTMSMTAVACLAGFYLGHALGKAV